MKRDEDVGEKKIVCLLLDVDYKLSMILSYRENKQNPKKSPCIIPLSWTAVYPREPVQGELDGWRSKGK